MTHSSVGLGWPLALYLCKEVYHAMELALSHGELGGCSERRSRTYYSCEQGCSFQATGSARDAFVPVLLEVYSTFSPSGHTKGEFFIFLLCYTLHWLPVLFLGIPLLALSWFSLALYLFLTRPCTTSSSSDPWYQTAGLCPAPFSFTMEYPVTGRKRRKRAGWDHAFPFLQAFLSVFPISFSPPGTCSGGLKTAVVYS